jgi:hypothetical protein
MKNWLSGLREAIQRPGDKIPDGWVTAKQAAKGFGVKHSTTAKKTLDAAVARGLVQKASFIVRTAGGSYARTTYYGPKK